MSTSQDDIRQQVIAQIVAVTTPAKAADENHYEVARRIFLAAPEYTLDVVHVETMSAAKEAWCLNIERTIDAEIIRCAIVEPEAEPIHAVQCSSHLNEALAVLIASSTA